MADNTVKRRLDYKAPQFSILETHLSIVLDPEKTRVKSLLKVMRNDAEAGNIVLDGKELSLLCVLVDGEQVPDTDYELTDTSLSIPVSKTDFLLEIENTISPANNTSLEGLYYVKGTFCTQCEAEGFRKITYFLDRPDILSTYSVDITAPEAQYPDVLSNGNLVNETKQNGMRTVHWHDPHPKPSYLFALVAGDFDVIEDRFTTNKSRDVKLQFFLEKGRKHQGQFAVDSLKRAMQWDEERYGLSYDLDVYMVVAVDFFNMGAMENKGLNVFNSKFVLAEPRTATDTDYFNIESIIAHEYFHNWTGNRVTCRDWFQLSLKEGLTVFRDQQFSADMSSPLTTRISQVKVMREHQFVEDAGPMSHPIRPDEVMEMNNFYTVTVYDKGAEVIRMMHTLLGESYFRKGMDLYFSRHDGCAVTCDDFVQSMQDASGIDLNHFKRWYSQSGTPVIKVEKTQTETSTTFVLKQENHPTADQQQKTPLYVPIKTQFIDEQGQQLTIPELHNQSIVMNEEESVITVDSRNISPAFLVDFSAPVIIDYEYETSELLHILQHSDSDFARWDASQNLYKRWTYSVYANQDLNGVVKEIRQFADAYQSLDVGLDVAAELISLPGFDTLASGLTQISPIQLENAKSSVKQLLADAIGEYALARLKSMQSQEYAYTQEQVHERSAIAAWLQLACLSDAVNKEGKSYLTSRYHNADNMTDKLNCLKVAQVCDLDVFDTLMLNFEAQYKHDAVVMDKWFSLHATTERTDILPRLDLLKAHSVFDAGNPNKIRAVIGSFGFYNIKGLHAADGTGYKYLCQNILEIDQINPQVASRILTPMLSFNRYDESHKTAMKQQLGRIFNSKSISKDLFEKVSKALLNESK